MTEETKLTFDDAACLLGETARIVGVRYPLDGRESLDELIGNAQAEAKHFQAIKDAGWEYTGLTDDSDDERQQYSFSHPDALFPGVGPCGWGECCKPATHIYARDISEPYAGALGFCDWHNGSPAGGGWEGFKDVTDAVMASVKKALQS
jgi:hypothetical protein